MTALTARLDALDAQLRAAAPGLDRLRRRQSDADGQAASPDF